MVSHSAVHLLHHQRFPSPWLTTGTVESYRRDLVDRTRASLDADQTPRLTPDFCRSVCRRRADGSPGIITGTASDAGGPERHGQADDSGITVLGARVTTSR